jgi:large subunit ribosomal protein L1
MIRTTITLPNGTGKKPRMCVFNDSGSNDELKKLGADVIGGEDLIEDIVTGKQAIDFDVCIATPSMMRNL